MIHPGTVFPLRISIDGHMLSIVSMDGYNVVPMSFESFIINPGERFDFVLSADQPTRNYWIRVDGMEVHFQKLLSLKSQVSNLIFNRLADHQLDVLTFSRRIENTSCRKYFTLFHDNPAFQENKDLNLYEFYNFFSKSCI